MMRCIIVLMIARERADRLLVARGLFESRARAQAAIAAGLVTADGVLVRKASDDDLCRRRDRGRARASLRLARRRQACGGARPFSSRRHGPHLPRCRRLDRGLYRITAARGARRVYAIDVGSGQLHPRCAARATSCRWSKPTSARSIRRGFAEPPDLAIVDVSFISLKLVLPAIGTAFAHARGDRRADQAAIRGPAAATQERHRARPGDARRGLRRHRGLLGLARLARQRRHAVADPRRRRQPRILHRGGAWLSGWDRPARPSRRRRRRRPRRRRSMFPARCPAKRSRSKMVAGHPDRRRLLHIEQPSAERIAPICPHFGVCGGCAVQHWDDAPVSRVETRSRGRGPAAGGTRLSGRRTHRRAWRRPPPRGLPCQTRQPRRAGSRLFRRARAPHGRDRPLPGAGAKAWRRDQSGVGHRRGARPGEQAARHSGHRDGCRPRCRRARLGTADGAADDRAGAHCRHARSRAAHAPRRTDHAGAGADLAHGQGDCALPPAAFLQATAEGEAALARLVACRLPGAAQSRRPVRRRRPVRVAARRAGTGRRRR